MNKPIALIMAISTVAGVFAADRVTLANGIVEGIRLYMQRQKKLARGL